MSKVGDYMGNNSQGDEHVASSESKSSTPQRRDRLMIQVTRNTLPQVKDKYPFLYLERGRLEVDDSSVKWIDCEKNIVKIPIATVLTLLLGPGTSITHEAVKVLSAANCAICWVGEDSLIFYASGHTPTADTRNMRHQMELAFEPEKSLEVARRMYAIRFPSAELKGKSLSEMMGMEGYRVRQLYEELAIKYNVGWKGRAFKPGNFELSDITNQILTSANAALYGILTSTVFSLGYSPHVGFIHSGCPLPFIYDLADLYKEKLCIDMAFSMTLELGGVYKKERVATEFRQRVIASDLLGQLPQDIASLLKGVRNARSNSE